MANYKNMRFNNTLADFERWCEVFPPLEVGKYIQFYRKGNYYMSIEKVNSFLGEGGSFAGVTIRNYDAQDRDFVYCNNEKVRKLFEGEILEYMRKHNLQG